MTIIDVKMSKVDINYLADINVRVLLIRKDTKTMSLKLISRMKWHDDLVYIFHFHLK